MQEAIYEVQDEGDFWKMVIYFSEDRPKIFSASKKLVPELSKFIQRGKDYYKTKNVILRD